MSTNNVGVNGVDAVSLSLVDVLSPDTSELLGAGVLGQAKKEMADEANKNLVELAKAIMSSAKCTLTSLTQEEVQLQAALDEVKKRKATALSYVEYASSDNKGLFALAAYVGLKNSVVRWCATHSVVIPANTDPIWGLPAQA